jgi:hypothetical protein
MTDNRKPKALTPSPEIRIEVFEIAADSPPPLTGGYYWHCAEHQSLRGPFATEEAAHADFRQYGLQMLSVILGYTVMDAASVNPELQTAAALIKEFGNKRRGR